MNHGRVLNRLLASAAAAALATAGPAGTTWFVDDDNCPGPGTGTEPDPFCSIQDAIDAAADTDEIVVAPGTYLETVDLLGKALYLRGPRGPEVATIDAQQTGTVVTCISGEGPDTVLDGFTITGGAADPSGAGMLVVGGSPTVTGCTFTGNTAAVFGGGMYNGGGSSPTVINCWFENNTADTFFGGAIANEGSSPAVVNCIFVANSAVVGGAMGSDGGSNPTVANCTFRQNTAVECGAIYSEDSTTVVSSILWYDSLPEICNESSTGSVTFSDIRLGYPGTGNIDVSPLWLDPDNGDFRLYQLSPCIDAGDNTAVPPGVTTDFGGRPRFVDDPDTADCRYAPGQCGDPPVVDMGAYEFQPCPWNCNHSPDRVVDVGDFLALVSQWGNVGSACDVDGGGVSVTDFLALLAHWGPCPPR
jgi:hypothetical protein